MVDFGCTAGDYAQYRAGFPDALFGILADRGIGGRGCRVLDLGTGTGALARGLAVRGATVFGLDPSAAMMEAARALDREAGVSVEYRVGRAEEPGFAEASFDAVTAGQCWHWFDRARAATACFRVLRPGGRLAIAHFDWIPLPGNLIEATERLILAHNPHWTMAGGTGLYPQWLGDAAGAGFAQIETCSCDLPVAYSHEGWRGRIRASAGVAASLPANQVAAFDRELASLLRTRFPEAPLAVPHRLWVMTAVKPR
jgi:SAM-dependent methyltransferase